MAAATNFHHRYLGGGAARLNSLDFGDQFEFDEADLWTADAVVNLTESKNSISKPRGPIRKPLRKASNADQFPNVARSLPVNVPDWSKILRGECLKRAGGGDLDGDFEDEEDEDCDGNDRLPPHEYLARTRGASFSVHEGIGRTLKGRDLSRVRNAIWKQTGFED